MKTDKFDKILDDINHFFEWGHYDSTIPLWTCIIILTSIMLYGYYNKPELEEYNLKEKLPKPQNEVVIHDSDIAKGIRHQKEVSVDFNRMYDELKGWKKITWPSQPLDTASWYRKIHP